MEESFSLTWEDSGAVVQNEEVICGIEETEILPGQTEEFRGTDNIPQNGQEMQGGNIMYLTEDNVLVMQESNENNFPQHFMDCQVTEEVVAEQWEENCPEEIVVGSEEAIGLSGEQASNEDVEIPLPTDQDEYTAARPYPCDFCSRRFRKKAYLMNHMIAHQTDKPHTCNLCGVEYMKKCELMNHLKIHAYIDETDNLEDEEVQPLDDSDTDKPRRSRKTFNKKRKKPKIKEEFENFEAGEIGPSSSRNYYTNVELMDVKNFEYLPPESNQPTEIRYPITDHRKPFVCQHCGVGFAREKALASHARIHGGDSPFECQKCNEMFWDISSMREHWRTKHGELEDYDEDEDEDYSEEDHKYGTFYCTTCGLSFHRQDNLKRHQRVHVKDEQMSQPEIGHICNVCGESFPEALDLLAHAEVHARGSDHRCMICGEDFEDDQGCAVHVQERHGNDLPPNTCMLCGRHCKDRKALLKHSWEHSKEKVFSCSQCAKTFHNKARLKRHMLSHRNKVVPCDVCGEEFPDGRTLMNHRHSHSSVSGRQFPCRECGKTFGSRSSQQIHIRIHTGERPYGCRFCWKAFADGGTLRKHERIHTGEKPYACAVCPRAFNQRVVLREHIRSHHSGPDPKYTHSMTPYCCSVCSDMFATSQDLIVHLIHHCDMNTAMKRQPQVGPRKYKRRRKLKPHELDLLSHRLEDENESEEVQPHNPIPEYEIDMERRKKIVRKVKKSSPKQDQVQFEDSYLEQETFPSTASLPESPPAPVVNSKLQTIIKSKKKLKNDNVIPPSRPKMIHTQKTRVPVEPGEDGRMRHRTKTTITRTQPTELKSATGERIRPRTKNVSYHVFNSDKLPLATFPEDITAVNNLLKQDQMAQEDENNSNGLLYLDQVETPEVAAEQTVEFNEPVPTNLIRVHRKPTTRQSARRANSLKPGRHIIGPGSKVRIVKSGMIVKKKIKEEKIEPEEGEIFVKQEENYEHEEQIVQEIPEEYVIPEPKHVTLQEFVEHQHEVTNNQAGFESAIQDQHEPHEEKHQVDKYCPEMRPEVDPSPLHELAEISMQHAQNLFKCEMCSAVFSDRAQLLVHVPIHI